MTVFLIERNFAEQLQVTPEGAASINKVNAEIGVQWLISFLSADKKKTYCLYEAWSAEAIREAACATGFRPTHHRGGRADDARQHRRDQKARFAKA